MNYIENMNSQNFQAKQSSSFRSITVVIIYMQQTKTEMAQKMDLCLI